MPQILIVTDSPDSAGEVIYRESVSAVHLASAHSGDQLVERLTWAVGDANAAERRARLGRRAPAEGRPGLRAACGDESVLNPPPWERPVEQQSPTQGQPGAG